MANTSISNMNKAQLIEEAKKRNMYTADMDNMKKADIVAILKGEQKEESEVEEAASPLQESHTIYAMRPALAAAHLSLNKKAITLDQAVEHGVPASAWRSWKSYVEGEFYDAVRKYFEELTNYNLAETKETRKERVTSAENSAWAKWRFVIKAGEEDKFHKHMYIEEGDIIYFFAFIYDRDGVDGEGQSFVSKGRQVFRKEVEALVGLRMANAKLRSDEETEFLKEYRSKLQSIESNQTRLNGRDTDKKHEPGILENIASTEKSIEIIKAKNEELAKKYNIPAEELDNGYIKTLESNLEELKKAKASAEKNKADATKYVEENKTRFVELSNSYNKIEL